MTIVTTGVAAGVTALALAVITVGSTGVHAQGQFVVVERRLDNGLGVIIGSGPTSPLFSEVLLVASAGSALDPRHEWAQVAGEALMIGAGADDTRLTFARMGVTASHTVGRDVAVFRFAVPAVNTVALLEWLARSLDRATVAEAAWDHALNQRAEQIAGEQHDLWIQASSRLSEMIWRTSASPPAAVTVADLDAFWSGAYAPANLVLALHTPLPQVELDTQVQRLLGRIAPRPPREAGHQGEPSLAPGGRTECLLADGATVPAMLIGVGAEVADDRVFYAWQLAAHVLGASHSSRLHARLRLETPSVYTVEATSVPLTSRRLAVRIALQSQELVRARDVVIAELKRIVRDPVRQDELNLARALLTSRLKMDRGSMRETLYHRALSWLGARRVSDGREVEGLLAAFTPTSLRDALKASANPRAVSTLILSARHEPICTDETSQ